jgi:hypothetical protein
MSKFLLRSEQAIDHRERPAVEVFLPHEQPLVRACVRAVPVLVSSS